MKALKKFYSNFISNRIHISLKPLTDWLAVWSLYLKNEKKNEASGIVNLCVVLDFLKIGAYEN